MELEEGEFEGGGGVGGGGGGGDRIDATPIPSLEAKWKLVPAFLKVRGLMKQHIASFNHFVNVDMEKIVKANSRVSSDSDPTFFLRFESIRVDAPAVKEEGMSQSKVTPHQCRLRDATYAAPVFVSIRYTRGNQVILSNDVQIGRLPIMLKSEKCALFGRSDYDLAIMKKSPTDPGG